MLRLTTRDEVDTVLARELAILYKHSTRCAISTEAYYEVEEFRRRHADAPVYWIDVVADRSLSQYVAARIQVPHHSPQVIVLRRGVPAWHGSHFSVTAQELEAQRAAQGW